MIRVAADLGYEPNTAAQSLAGHRTGLIGLVVFDSDRLIDTKIFSGFIIGVTRALQARGLHAVLLLPEEDSDRRAVGRSILTDNLDGAIVIGHRADDPVLAELVRDRTPTVCFGQPIGHRKLWWVDQDNALGAQLAIEHLVESGRRRIAVLAGPQDRSWGRERLRGARAALHAAGLAPAGLEMCDFTPDSGRDAMRKLLAEAEGLDAVFACSEAIGRGALAALAEADIDVPAELGFVTYDDAPEFEHRMPPVTVIQMPLVELGAEAARLMVDRIRAQSGPSKHTLLSPSLVVRDSTASH